MFSCKVVIDETDLDRGKSPLPARVMTPRAETSVGALYGFRFEYRDGIAIGESLNPVTPDQIEKLVRQCRHGRVDARMLGNDILLLVVVSDGFVNLISSICCCRPLYYHHRRNHFCCSTSIRELGRVGVPLQTEESAVPEFLVYRYAVPPRTLYQGIKRLLGGESIRVDLPSGAIVETASFDFMRSSRDIHLTTSSEELPGILREQLATTLGNHARSGVLLSGGLDSGALASIALQLTKDVSSVSSSFGFIDETDAETEYALSFARALPMSHHIYEGSEEEYLSGLVESIYVAEEPVHHLQSVMLYLLFKNHARERYSVLFCGEGADGLFGNDMHSFLHRRRRVLAVARALGGNALCRLLTEAFDVKDDRVRRLALDYGDDLQCDHHVLWTLGRYGDADFVRTHFGFDNAAILESHKELMRRYPDRGMLDRVTMLSLLCEGAVSMYIWSKLAESQGIVIHYPFTATATVDYVTSLPWGEKLRESKFCIRSLLRRCHVPETLITRPKLSFGFPYRHWALPGGMFQPILDLAQEMFDPALLRSLQSEEPGRAMLLWNLINLYLWRKLMISNVSPDDLSLEILSRRRALIGRA